MKIQNLPFKLRTEAIQEIERQVEEGLIRKSKLKYNKLIDSFLWELSEKGQEYWESINKNQFNKIAC